VAVQFVRELSVFSLFPASEQKRSGGFIAVWQRSGGWTLIGLAADIALGIAMFSLARVEWT